MWDLFDFIIDPLLYHFARIYDADRRPEARKLTLGCMFVVIAVIFLLGLIFSYRS